MLSILILFNADTVIRYNSGFTAVVFQNQILVCGGSTSVGDLNCIDSIEVLDLNDNPSLLSIFLSRSIVTSVLFMAILADHWW